MVLVRFRFGHFNLDFDRVFAIADSRAFGGKIRCRINQQIGDFKLDSHFFMDDSRRVGFVDDLAENKMNTEFTTENFHDTYIISVFENTVNDEIEMLIDFPINWFESEYEKKKLLFKNAFNYQVHEMRFTGSPQILEVSIIEKQENWIRFQLATNAGYREISCESVEMVNEK